VNLNVVPRIRDTTRVRRMKGNLLVARTDATLELSETAEFIFRRIDGMRTLGDISAVVALHYDIPLHIACQDTTELLAQLMEQQIMDMG
jgi:hypothetical protein